MKPLLNPLAFSLLVSAIFLARKVDFEQTQHLGEFLAFCVFDIYDVLSVFGLIIEEMKNFSFSLW